MTERYLFQTGNSITGKRGEEGGWQSSNGFEVLRVVAADIDNGCVYWNITYHRLVGLFFNRLLCSSLNQFPQRKVLEPNPFHLHVHFLFHDRLEKGIAESPDYR